MLRTRKNLLTVVFITMMVTVAGLGFVFTMSPDKDSGVGACESIIQNVGSNTNGGGESMTESDYFEARAPFENSKHDDIRIAGIGLIETIYKMDTDHDFNDTKATLMITSKLNEDWREFQSACENHGVKIPSLLTVK